MVDNRWLTNFQAHLVVVNQKKCYICLNENMKRFSEILCAGIKKNKIKKANVHLYKRGTERSKYDISR